MTGLREMYRQNVRSRKGISNRHEVGEGDLVDPLGHLLVMKVIRIYLETGE